MERHATVSVAQSYPGGMLSSHITDVPGSSGYCMGGAVCYTADSKMFIAGVDPALIQQFGEVSEQVAVDLAKGVRRRFDRRYGMGVSGVAGPGGGPEGRAVGTVAGAGEGGSEYEHRKLFWRGSLSLLKS